MSGYSHHGPTSPSVLPITYWFPAWFGISPWASPFWTARAVLATTKEQA